MPGTESSPKEQIPVHVAAQKHWSFDLTESERLEKILALAAQWPKAHRLVGINSCIPRAMVLLAKMQSMLINGGVFGDLDRHEAALLADELGRTGTQWLEVSEELGVLPARKSDDPERAKWFRRQRLCGVNGVLSVLAVELRMLSAPDEMGFKPLSFLTQTKINEMILDLAATAKTVLAPIHESISMIEAWEMSELDMKSYQITASRILKGISQKAA